VCFHSKNERHPSFDGVGHFEFGRALPFPFYHRFAAFFHNSCFDNLDVLHLPLPQFPYIRQPRVPVVVTIHDLTPLFMPQYHNWKRVLHFRKFLPWYLGKVKGIVAVSNATKADIVKFYNIPEEKISVVHEGKPDVAYKKCKKEPYILYLGTLEPRKNVEGLIKAFSILKSRGLRKKLVIAGGAGWKYQSIFSLVGRLGLRDDVVFKGYVSEKDMDELFGKAEVFVYPSFYEGFGLSVLDAMARGVPVVTSCVSSLPEVVGDAGVLVNPYDVGGIAGGIEEALSSSRVLANRGLRRAKLFSVDRMTKGLLEVYEGVLK
jgi:glycosyltransferase involved in cell wall biosynthesis